MTGRRRFLQSLTGGLGLAVAGCSRSDTTGTPSSRRTDVYTFADDVPDELRKRVYRVDDRLESIVGRQPNRPTRIATVESEPTRGRSTISSFVDLLDTAQHVSPADTEFSGSLGWAGTHTDVDGQSQVTFRGDSIRDSLIAHELFHVIQAEVVGSVDRTGPSHDASKAAYAVKEGAAEYVEWIYDQQCRDGAFEPCKLPDRPSLSRVTPLVLARFGHPYFSGMGFIHAVYERGGWAGVWDAHRAPPRSTAGILEPERYASGGVDPSEPSVPYEAPEDWLAFERTRVGVFALYTKLFALDVVSLSDPAAAAPPSMRRRTGWSKQFDSQLLRGWQGDQFVGFGHLDSGDRMGYAWVIEWESPSAARDLAAAIESGYDNRGTYRDGRWHLGETVVGIDLAGDRVTFTMAPDKESFDTIFS